MAIELVKVDRVDSTVPPFTIYGWTVEDSPKPVKVHTWDSLKASACERAMKAARYVWMTYRDRRFGVMDLTTVRIDDSAFETDEDRRQREQRERNEAVYTEAVRNWFKQTDPAS